MTTPKRAMAYGWSQLDFPNWWEALDGDGGEASDSSGQSGPHRSRVSGSECGTESSPDALPEQAIVLAWGRGAYSPEVIESVWELAEAVSGNDSELWRKDEFGNWIHRFDYGSRDSRFGWEVFDPGIGRHYQGVYAMRPMQWESYLSYCQVLP